MADYSGQIMGQQYGMGEMGHSPAGMQRMQTQHPSPQQQHAHMIPSGQMIPQQQIMMQSSQPMQVPPCSSMPIHQLQSQMGAPQMISQQGVTILSQPAQIQQAGSAPGQLIQSQHQMLPGQNQQQQSQMMSTSMGQQQMIPVGQQSQSGQQHHIMQPSPQMIQHQTMNAQQPVGHSPGFAHPTQPHLRVPNTTYQQTSSPHRPAMTRYPTSSPENAPHSTAAMYRAPLQRPPPPPRMIGQSSAIRQALGHLPSTASTSSLSTNTDQVGTQGSLKLLEKDALEKLIKSVDPLETVEDDVSDALLQLVDEFVDDLVDQTARVAKHRNATKLEAKDVQYVLERRFRMFLPAQPTQGTVQPPERNPYSKPPTVDAHRQRMNLIKKVIQKP